MQQVDTDPPSLPVGTEVSAKYKGAFCEAKVSKVVRNIKVKVAYKQGLGSGIVPDDLIKVAPGQLRVGATVEVRHPDRKDLVECTVTKIQDCSQYTVVFDDGDITTLRRTALCLKSGRHFNESETLDQLPLTHPEHFGNPVVGGRRGRRRGQLNDDSSDEEDESDAKEVVNEKEEHIGNVVCVEMETKKKDKEKWFPGLILAPTAQANVRIRVKDEYLVRSFKDGRYYTVPKKETTEFTREAAAKQDGQAVQAALQYLDSGALPPHWDRESLFGLNNSSSEGDGELESDSSDDEPREEKDRFVAQLYKYMDDRGTPLNKVPSIQNRDVDLYRLFRAVQKCGGYNRVTAKNQWKSIAVRLGFTSVTVSVTNLVKQAYKKFLQPYGEFHRKLGCSMLMTPRNSNRSKGRSLVRANSVASPKPIDSSKESLNKPASNTIAASSFSSSSSASSGQNIAASSVVTTTANVITVVTPSVTEESENTSESSLDNAKNKRKTVVGKVKGLVEKYEEKSRDDCDVPLSKIRTSAETPRCEEKDKAPSLKDVPAAPTLHIRDSSPPGTSAGSKKDKSQKKQTPQSDDKRNKRKKDDTIEKVDTGDFIVEVGDKLKVYYHEKKVTYEAKVIEISVQRGSPMYLVHYTGWNNRYDEWVPRERIAENITKGSKQKGRMSNASGIEKQKENPSKPPSVSSLNPSGPPNSMVNIIGNTPISTKLSVSSKRGRGRSDSLPPRSTTPSSVASNSSRTKSPATSGLKRRPIRSMVNTTRRTSANVSDVSLQSESDTDSDEPVRRPTRGSKEIEYKSGSLSGKVANKSINSDTDVDDDEDDTSIIIGTNSNSTKGRNYDLNQIRSELRGLKSPSPSYVRNDESLSKVTQPIKVESVIDVKDVCSSKSKAMVESNAEVIAIKQEVKQDQKDDNVKSSTDMSSETESFCDDDSQSSGKTTTLENMTKRFQQKIKAGKQQAFEKLSCGNPAVERVPKVVEKIIQDSLAEKLQEILKTKPEVKKEEGLEADISDAALCKSDIDKEDSKQKSVQTELIQKNTSNIQPRFESTICSSKYSSLIVEKPVCSNKKIESGCCKKTDIIRKGVTDNIESQSKKSIEPLVKELNKGEPSAACSPSSSSSSSSASASSSSRSLPDMSKLDISGGSSTSSIYVMPNKDAKLISIAPKATSPDIYEFKDPEPFEFELRKLQTTSANISSLTTGITSACNVSGISRKSTQKSVISQISVNEKQQPPPNPMTVLVNRKKKGSPMKETVVDKPKLLKTEGKLNVMSDGKINKIASTISVVTKNTLDSQTNLMTLNPLSENQQISLCSNSITQKIDTLNNTSFDTLRTSPNFNVNINALNEELAQTVQETTRALTDAFQKPKLSSLQEVTGTPPNLASPKQNDIENLMTPSKSQQENVSTLSSPLPTVPIKTVIGSPFIETRKDLSNVFELSTSEGFTSLSESKDNKFEFENAKKMLSATSDAFDLEPAKYENRPTSIADKLLKAISQKKEEDKYKIEPKNEKGEDGGSSKDDFTVVKNTAELILGNDSASNEPLNINIDLAGSPMSFGSNLSLEKLPIITGSINKPIPLTSPEPKLGILESITVKNNDLTETIQKLECAIQRKTPVSGLSVTTTPNTFSEDSMDSTDSERRLVIEDVAEDMCDILKSPNDSQHIGETKISILSHKTDVAVSKVVPDNISPHIRADSQIPQTPHTSRPQCLSASVPFPTISAPIVVTSANKISTVLHVVADMTNEQKEPQFGNQEVQKKDKRKQEGSLSVGIENSANNETRSNENTNLRDSYSVKSFETVAPSPLIESSKQQTQRSTDVVPISVPDIPVSVVVASGAVPSVKAAAQAAAEAAVQSPISKIHTTTNVAHKAPVSKTLIPSNLIVSSEETLTIDTNLESKINIQDSGVYIDASNDLKITPPSTVTCPSVAGTSANSGFYLDMRTELRPEDGVKPIHDTSHTNIEIERFSCKKVEASLCADELASNFGVDTNNESINLLCEETIPGSPTPAFGGKEEPSGTQLATESTLLLDSNIKVLGVTEPGALLANMNNSPNDSASHDDSSEDVKKQVDMENEISPRKRRRPRKQSEMIIISDHHTKRRRQMACMKKIPAGSDSDENSDGTSHRILESRHHFQQQFQLQQPQTSVGIRSCPYNFLVHLDPSLGSDQCIAILLKQIQELRKTYNAIKIDLASIDRRRKKLRRREREKKQQVQNQQVKIS